jgi:hypothetical protein
MDQRLPHPRRAGALYALLSALVCTFLLLVVSTGSAGASGLDALAKNAMRPPAPPDSAANDTTFDGFVYISTTPAVPCTSEFLSLRFAACRCNTELTSVRFGLDGAPTYRAVVRPDHLCIQCDPQEQTLPLGVFAAGHHQILIHSTTVYVHADSSVDSTTADNWFTFDVRNDCPPPTGIQYLHGVWPGHPSACTVCPPEACPGDSIPLYMFGAFPNPCLRLKEVRLISPVVVGGQAPPYPPLVEVVYARNSCDPVVCPEVVTPWQVRTFLPPLPPSPPGSPYILHVRGVLEDDCAVLPPLPMGQGDFAFVVVESCSTSANACFRATFANNEGSRSCNATYGAGKPAEATLLIQTAVPLAGLQGTLVLDAPALQIQNIEATGVAHGMVLQWTHEGNGARFVMYAEHGAPIVDSTLSIPPNPVSVLLVTVAPNPLVDAPLPQVAYLWGRDLLGSDEQGRAVPYCPIITLEYPPEPRARLCLAAPCDHNGDAVADVRDLVLLVRCVQNEGECPDPITSMDCVLDGHLDLDDVLCCANVVLGVPPSDSLTGRDEPRVTAALDAPKENEDGTIELAVRIGGTNYVGASRLELSYPWLRYELVDLVKPTNSRWLPVSQENPQGKVVMGLIAIQPLITLDVPGEETWRLRLRLRDGQTAGGAVSLSNASFAGPDGVGLVTGFVPQSVPLGATAGLALSAPRPNPFAGETSFTIELDDPADLDVGVYDLAGRRVATVFRGLAPSGMNEYRWNGRIESGDRAKSGVYFFRAISAGQVATKKVMFVRATLVMTNF